MYPRSRAGIEALFGGLSLLPPGLVAVAGWRPSPAETTDVPDDHPVLAGVARQG
jgi:hypothetical protein